MNNFKVIKPYGSECTASFMESVQCVEQNELERKLQVEESKLLLMKQVRQHQRTHSLKKPKLKLTKTTLSPKSQKVKEANKKTKNDHSKHSSKHHEGRNSGIFYDEATLQEKKELTGKINDQLYKLPKLVIPDVNGIRFLPTVDSNDYLESLSRAHIKHVLTKHKPPNVKPIFYHNSPLKECPTCPKCDMTRVKGWKKWKEVKMCIKCYVISAKEASKISYNSNLVPKLDEISILETKLNSVDKPLPLLPKVEEVHAKVTPASTQPAVPIDFDKAMQQYFSIMNDPIFIQNFMANYFGANAMNMPGFQYPPMGNPALPQLTPQQALMADQSQLEFIQKMFSQAKPNGT